MTDEPKPPAAKPQPGHNAFKDFLTKLAKVPKAEIDEREAEYRRMREKKKRRASYS
jgi:hypothetical protein